ncbi:hypothetical protein ACU8KH_03668 [Lachancea thermotolerans]
MWVGLSYTAKASIRHRQITANEEGTGGACADTLNKRLAGTVLEGSPPSTCTVLDKHITKHEYYRVCSYVPRKASETIDSAHGRQKDAL